MQSITHYVDLLISYKPQCTDGNKKKYHDITQIFLKIAECADENEKLQMFEKFKVKLINYLKDKHPNIEPNIQISNESSVQVKLYCPRKYIVNKNKYRKIKYIINKKIKKIIESNKNVLVTDYLEHISDNKN
jgi:hypothetical protein